MYCSILKKSALIVIAVAGFGSFSSQGNAASYEHLDQLAVRLQGQSRELINEIRIHYRHTAEYGRLISDTYEMYRVASRVHALAHTRQSLHQIECDLQRLDRLHDHIQDRISQCAVRPHGGHRHGGHVHGRTGHVHRLLRCMEETLQHMFADVREMNRCQNRIHAVPGRSFYDRSFHDRSFRGSGDPGFRHGVGIDPNLGRHGSIRFGNSNFSIRFGF